MAGKQLCFVAFCLLALVAPSFQAGTIYTDFLTPVREDATFFEGISSHSVTVSGAAVGTLQSGHREGFFIESDGPIESTTGTVTINAAQLIDFTGHSEGGSSTVRSAGTVSMAGSHLDVDAGTFTGSGNAGSVTSGGALVFSGGEVNVGTGNGAILFNATENDLTLAAAQGLSLVAGDGTIAFENGVAFASDIGGTSFAAAQGLNLLGNLVDIRSQNGATIDTTGSQTFTAGSIVELRSDDEVALSASGDIDVTSTNNFIRIDAASAAVFTAAGDLTTTATGSISIANQGSSESIFEFNNNGAVEFNAFTDADFATFGSGDIGFEASNSVDVSAQDNVSVTAGETLDVSSVNSDVNFSSVRDMTLTSSTKNFTIAGEEGVNLSAVGNDVIELTADSIHSTSQGGTVFATLGDVTVSTDDFRFEQIDHNEQNSGSFTMNIGGDFSGTNEDTIFESAGTTTFAAGSAAPDDISITAGNFDIDSGFGPNDITLAALGGAATFNVDGTTEVDTSEARFFATGAFNLDGSAIEFDVNNIAKATFEAADIVVNVGDELQFSAGNVLTVEAAAGLTFDADDHDIDAERAFLYAGQDITVDADNVDLTGTVSVNFEAENSVSLESSNEISIGYQKSATVTGDTILIDADANLDVFAEEIYFVANFPTDTFDMDVTDELDIFAFVGTVSSGGDLNLDTSVLDTINREGEVTGYDSISIDAGTGTFTASSFLEFISDGALDISADDIDFAHTGTLTVTPGPDAGDLGDGVLLFSADDLGISADDYDETATTGDISVSADNYSLTSTTSDITVTAADSWEFTADQTFTTVVNGDLRMDAELGANTDSVDYTVIANVDVTFNQLDSTTIASDVFEFSGVTSTTINVDNVHMGANDLDIIVGEDLIVNAMGDLTYLANSQLSFTQGTTTRLTVGADLNVNGDETVTITSDTITYTGGDMVVNGIDFTTIDSNEDVVNTVTGEGDLFGDTIVVQAGGDITIEATDAAGIMTTAHDGEISFHQTGAFTVTAAGASSDTGDVVFDATRSARTEGELTYQSDGRFDIGLGDSLNPGVYVHTTSMDGNAVFDSTQGDFRVQAGSLASADALAGSFLMAGQAGHAYTTEGDITWSAGSGITNTASENYDFDAADTLSLSFLGTARSNMESQGTISFTAAGAGGDPIVNIDVGEDMTISTGQQGSFEVTADANLDFTTQREAAYVATNDFLVSGANTAAFTATNGDIDVYTAGGEVSVDSGGDLTTTSGTDTVITAGRDMIAGVGDMTMTAGTTFTAHAVDGAMIVESDAATFTAAATVTIDAQGARTDPRDGVIIAAADMTSSSTAGDIVLNAFDEVVFGELSTPDVVLTLAGTPSVPGFVAVSDSAIRLNSEATIEVTPADNFDLTTTQELAYISDGTLTIESDTQLLAQATNGNVHLHADGHTTVIGDTMTLTATTGNFKITGESRTPGSALRFEGDSDIESRSLLSNSGLFQSTPASNLVFDGISGFTIASSEGSVGTVSLSSAGDSTATANADFEVRSLKGDGGITVTAATGNVEVTTLVSGDIIFDASSDNSHGALQMIGDNVVISSLNSFTITAENPAHDDLRNGDIVFRSLDSNVQFMSADQMEFETVEDFEIYTTQGMTMTAQGDVAFISDEDMIFHAQGGGYAITATNDFELQNSPESEGDFIIMTGSVGDQVTIDAANEIFLVTGENWIGENTGSLVFDTSAADSLDGFGFRLQSEAVGGDIDFISNSDMGVFAPNTGDISFTTIQGEIRFDTGLSSSWFSNTVDLVTTDTNNGGGDVNIISNRDDVFITQQSFGAGSFEVFSSAEDNQAGRMHFEANGINPGSENGIAFQSVGVGGILIASQGNDTTEGNTVSFTAEEDFEINLNGVFAYFGALDHDFVDSFFPYGPGYYGYNSNLFGADPEQQVTTIETFGLDADILFTSRASQDGHGELHVVTGLVDRLGFAFESYYADGRDAQLLLVADGGSDAEIRFDVESGIIFRGVSSPYNYDIAQYASPFYGSYLPESDANFVALDLNADIVLKTDDNAQQADITFNSHDILFQSQDRSWYGTTGDFGGDVTVLVSDGDVKFTTRNDLNTDASPGIAINAYDSKIHVTAEQDSSVNFEAVRDLRVRADGGYHFEAETMVMEGGDLNLESQTGDVTWISDDHTYNATDSITFTTREPSPLTGAPVGGDIKFRSAGDMTLTVTDPNGGITVQSTEGGNILFHFGSFLEVQGDAVVAGFMTFPMTQEDVRPGTFCNNLIQDNEVLIVKQPLHVVSPVPDLYSKFGISLCTCNRETSTFACMNMDEFVY